MTTPQPRIISVPMDQPDDLDALGAAFGNTADVTRPIKKELRVEWFNGSQPTDSMEVAVGLHIEADVHPEVDAVYESLGTKSYVVERRSKDKDGKPRKAKDGKQRPCSLFVLSKGLKSIYEMKRSDDRVGMAYAWEIKRDTEGNALYKEEKPDEVQRQPRLELLVILHDLVRYGITMPLPLDMSGYIVADMLNELDKQFQATHVLEDYYRGKGQDVVVPFYGLSIPFVPGTRRMVGKPGKDSPIYPPVAQVEQTTSYFKQHMSTKDMLALIQEPAENGHVLINDVVVASIQRSQEINNESPEKREPGANQLNGLGRLVLLAASSFSTLSLPTTSQAEEDPLASAEDIEWVRNVYAGNVQKTIQSIYDYFHVSDLSHLRASQVSVLRLQVS